MHFEIITLFPEFFDGFFSTSIIGRAREKGALTEHRILLRDFALNRYGQVDDAPYGGGAGMVLRPEPAGAAILKARELCAGKKTRTLFLTPQGRRLTQPVAAEYASEWEAVVIFCGHYKGLDERVVEKYVDDEVSIGDYVLTGGELPAMVFIDAVVRLLDNVLGDRKSAENDSLATGLLEGPLYTRPEEFEGMKVPEVLRSGHFKKIGEWAMEQSLARTWHRRPDLINEESLDKEQKEILKKIKESSHASHHQRT